MQALIVGGGVAGPVTAMALQQVGIEATIFESHPPSDGELGSYFTLTANGLEALAAIGARELAIAAGFPTRRNVLWNETGRRLASLPLDSSMAGSPAAHTMKRSRLTRLLQEEAIRRGIRIDFGRRLGKAEVAADGRVLATFDDGSTASGDLLIGADGVHSVVRRAHRSQRTGGSLRRPDQLWRCHARRREGHRARGLAPDLRAAGILRLPGHAGRRRRVVRQCAAPTDHGRRARLRPPRTPGGASSPASSRGTPAPRSR